MEFSEFYSQDNCAACLWSPDGRFISSVAKHRLIVRDASSLQIIQLFTCLDMIDRVIWSPDSDYVACAQYKRGVLQVS
jgi:WD40 repeat protein